MQLSKFIIPLGHTQYSFRARNWSFLTLERDLDKKAVFGLDSRNFLPGLQSNKSFLIEDTLTLPVCFFLLFSRLGKKGGELSKIWSDIR